MPLRFAMISLLFRHYRRHFAMIILITLIISRRLSLLHFDDDYATMPLII